MAERRCRFAPPWDPNGSLGVEGLIELALDVYNTIDKKDEKEPRALIELGSHLGESAAIWSAFGMFDRIVCVDTWPSPEAEEIFNDKLRHRILGDTVIPVKSTTTEAITTVKELIRGFKVCAVYIDASHDYADVTQDINNYHPLITPGGWLCGHDYNARAWPACKQAVDDFIGAHNLPNLKTYRDMSWAIRLD